MPVPAFDFTKSQMHEAGSRLWFVSYVFWAQDMDDLHVAVWWRERASLGDVGRAAHENVVLRNGIALFVAVQVGRDSKLGIREVALLDKDLGTHARVDSRGRVVLEARAVDVCSSKSD